MAKPQALFVDDDPLVLQGLQRSFRPTMTDLDTTCTGNGQGALDRLTEPPFKVLVSDMRMPGMNRGERMNEIMKPFPAKGGAGLLDRLEAWEALAREAVAGKGGA